MSDSEWRYSSGRKGSPKMPIKKEKSMKCPKCGNKIECYTDGSVSPHKDYGKDPRTGKPKTKGAWAYCTNKRWD
jgi:hypothetical protein